MLLKFNWINGNIVSYNLDSENNNDDKLYEQFMRIINAGEYMRVVIPSDENDHMSDETINTKMSFPDLDTGGNVKLIDVAIPIPETTICESTKLEKLKEEIEQRYDTILRSVTYDNITKRSTIRCVGEINSLHWVLKQIENLKNDK